MSRWRSAGVDFEHCHMGDNLRTVFDQPDAEVLRLRVIPADAFDPDAARRRRIRFDTS